MWKVKWKLYKTHKNSHHTCHTHIYVANVVFVFVGIAVSFAGCEHACYFRTNERESMIASLVWAFGSKSQSAIHFPTQTYMASSCVWQSIHFTFTDWYITCFFPFFLIAFGFEFFIFVCVDFFFFSKIKTFLRSFVSPLAITLPSFLFGNTNTYTCLHICMNEADQIGQTKTNWHHCPFEFMWCCSIARMPICF